MDYNNNMEGCTRPKLQLHGFEDLVSQAEDGHLNSKTWHDCANLDDELFEDANNDPIAEDNIIPTSAALLHAGTHALETPAETASWHSHNCTHSILPETHTKEHSESSPEYASEPYVRLPPLFPTVVQVGACALNASKSWQRAAVTASMHMKLHSACSQQISEDKSLDLGTYRQGTNIVSFSQPSRQSNNFSNQNHAYGDASFVETNREPRNISIHAILDDHNAVKSNIRDIPILKPLRLRAEDSQNRGTDSRQNATGHLQREERNRAARTEHTQAHVLENKRKLPPDVDGCSVPHFQGADIVRLLQPAPSDETEADVRFVGSYCNAQDPACMFSPVVLEEEFQGVSDCMQSKAVASGSWNGSDFADTYAGHKKGTYLHFETPVRTRADASDTCIPCSSDVFMRRLMSSSDEADTFTTQNRLPKTVSHAHMDIYGENSTCGQSSSSNVVYMGANKNAFDTSSSSGAAYMGANIGISSTSTVDSGGCVRTGAKNAINARIRANEAQGASTRGQALKPTEAQHSNKIHGMNAEVRAIFQSRKKPKTYSPVDKRAGFSCDIKIFMRAFGAALAENLQAGASRGQIFEPESVSEIIYMVHLYCCACMRVGLLESVNVSKLFGHVIRGCMDSGS
jgi:hypothetical protein